MKICQKCKSNRIVHITAKCSDMCFTSMPSAHLNMDSYAPCIPHVTGPDSDYVEFEVCLECGQLQGKFPVSNPKPA